MSYPMRLLTSRAPAGSAKSESERAEHKAAAVAPVGSGVVVVEPVPTRLRATIVRTCRESAVIEFDGPANAQLYDYDLAKALCAQVPEDAWTENGDTGCYIDRIDTVDASGFVTRSALAPRGRKAASRDALAIVSNWIDSMTSASEGPADLIDRLGIEPAVDQLLGEMGDDIGDRDELIAAMQEYRAGYDDAEKSSPPRRRKSDAETRARDLGAAIRAWDKQDIHDLLAMIEDLGVVAAEAGLDPQGYVDMSALPSAPIPDDVDTAYPVWAMDRAGNMLVGDDASDVITLDEYREATGEMKTITVARSARSDAASDRITAVPASPGGVKYGTGRREIDYDEIAATWLTGGGLNSDETITEFLAQASDEEFAAECIAAWGLMDENSAAYNPDFDEAELIAAFADFRDAFAVREGEAA